MSGDIGEKEQNKSQIPALLFSTATGVIVTRAAAASDLRQDIVVAFTKYPRPLYIGSGLLFALGMIPGLPTVPFVILASLMGGMGYMVAREGTAQEVEGGEPRPSGAAPQPGAAPAAPGSDGGPSPAPASPEEVMRLLTVDSMEAEIGYAIILHTA